MSAAAHEDTSRIDTAQTRFLRERNFDVAPPLVWHGHGDRYRNRRPSHHAR